MATKPVFKDTDQGPVIRRKLNELGTLFEEGMEDIEEAAAGVILAKQYRDEAEGFKNITVSKAGEAEGHATDAKASELAAKASENAAAQSEGKAKASELAAKASELASKDSELASALSETNAKESELAAKDSELASAQSETNAKDSELLAKDWAIKEGGTVDGEEYSAKHYARMAHDVVAGGTVVTHEATDTIEFEGIGSTNFPLKANFVGTKAAVGLGNVDNTSDLDKPISTATQIALDLKASASDLADLADSVTDTLIPLIDAKVDKEIGHTLYPTEDKTKLSGIAAGATKNATDAQLRDRSTHTGVQPISSVTNLQSSLDSKVDKQVGYGLSQENYTPAEKIKLASLEGSKFKGEYVSLAALKAAQPSPEVGSYAYVDVGVGEVVTKYIWDSSDAEWVKQQGETASLTPAEIKSLYEGNPDTNAFTDSEKTKLAGVQAGATANATNAQLRDRSTHTGTQPASSITGLTKAAVGLDQVDNTADLDKPISTATQSALGGKQDKLAAGTNITISGNTISAANTTYEAMSQAEIRTGTATTSKVIAAKTFYDAAAFVALSSNTTITPNLNTGNNFTLTLTHNATLANPTGAKSGQSGTIYITHSGTNTLSFGTAWKFIGTLPDLPNVAGAVVITYQVVNTSNILATFGVVR